MRWDANDVAGIVFILCIAALIGGLIYKDAQDEEREDTLRARCVELRMTWSEGNCIGDKR
jgi:hypothetical protein